MHRITLLMALVVAMVATTSLLPAQRKGSERKDKPASYAVVQIGNDVKVVKADQLSSLKKQVRDEYAKAQKNYQAAKKAAAKQKRKFEGEKPVRKKLKVLSNHLKSEAAANEAMQKHLARLSSKNRTKTPTKKHVVVDVGGKLQVVSEADFKGLRRTLDAEYRKALRAYHDAEKQAKRKKQPFDQKKPTKPVARVMATFNSKEQAEAHLAKLEAKGSKSDK